MSVNKKNNGWKIGWKEDDFEYKYIEKIGVFNGIVKGNNGEKYVLLNNKSIVLKGNWDEWFKGITTGTVISYRKEVTTIEDDISEKDFYSSSIEEYLEMEYPLD